MKKAILLLGVLLFVALSVAQSYKYGEMVGWAIETHTYHGVTQKMAAYHIKQSMTTYTISQGTTKPSELANQHLVEFRIAKDSMFIKDKSGKEVKYSILLIGSSAR